MTKENLMAAIMSPDEVMVGEKQSNRRNFVSL